MATSGRLTAEQFKQYDEDGFVILEGFFSAEEMDVLCAHIDVFDDANNKRILAEGSGFVQAGNQIIFTNGINFLDPFIQAFTAQQRFVDLTTQLLGPDVRLYWDQSVYKRPEVRKDFPWHQDNGYTRTVPEHYTTCWIALNDATIENGCVWVLPRTHRQGVVEHRKTDIGYQCYFGADPGTPVELPKGGMVVFHSTLFHRSGPNVSNGMRKAYIAQYTPVGAHSLETGEVFDNGPVIARNGISAYTGFYQKALRTIVETRVVPKNIG